MKHFILGTLSGLILGGATGLLKTPRSGKENRSKLKHYKDDVSVHAKDVADKTSHLKDSISSVQFELEKLQGPFMDQMTEIASQYQMELQPRLRRIQEKQEDLNKDIDKMNKAVSK